VLAPDGDGVWRVGIRGRTVTTRAMKGFRYLHLLLERPHVELTALALAAAVAGHLTQVHQHDLGQVLDRQALTAYKRRIAELDDELAEARSWSDDPRTARLVSERSMLLDQIAAATGIGQRHRTAGASAERARVAVQKSITAAIRRITDLDAGLGRLLRDCIRTGGYECQSSTGSSGGGSGSCCPRGFRKWNTRRRRHGRDRNGGPGQRSRNAVWAAL